MTTVTEHLASLDSTLAAARTAWEGEKKILCDRILALKLELSLHKDLATRATESRMAAERVATKFITQFAVVAHVFEEAKRLALSVGYDENQLARNSSPGLEAAKQLVDLATATATPTAAEAPHVPT